MSSVTDNGHDTKAYVDNHRIARIPNGINGAAEAFSASAC